MRRQDYVLEYSGVSCTWKTFFKNVIKLPIILTIGLLAKYCSMLPCPLCCRDWVPNDKKQ